MRRAVGTVGRWSWRLVKLVVVLVLLALTALLVMGAITTHRGLPQTTGTIAVAGLNSPVTVIRDSAGILQITADDRHDLFMAQGYVHAQERMWQMEINRRIGAGRLAELFGSSQLDTDTYIRTLGWRVAAQRDLDGMSSGGRAILQAYADGVNAWITEHDGRLATPFVVAGLLSGSGGVGGYTLEPWTPLDTATWQKVQAWSLGGNVDSEIFRLLADEQLGDPAKTDELFPAYDVTAPVVTRSEDIGEGTGGPPAEAVASSASPASPVGGSRMALTDEHAAALADLGGLGSSVAALAGFDRGGGMVGDHGVGSNNWVVSGAHTVSGKPILANDPHLGFGMPSIWIINGLHCRTVGTACPWDVAGVSFPGAPAVILGHNARIAWGSTNVNPDTQDLFAETVDPSDPSGHYIFQGRSLPFEVRREVIKVAGADDVELAVRSTVHGVVLSDADARLKDGPTLALRWTATAEVDRTLESIFALNVATNFIEFRDAFRTFGSPSQHFVYADVDGHIGYVLPGLVPIRDNGDCQPPDRCAFAPTCAPGVDCDISVVGTGEEIRNGEDGTEEWLGYVPFDELPWQLDPASGVIVSANNAPVDESYPAWLGRDYDPGYRAARITERLATIEKLTPDDMRAIQMDTFVGRADEVLSLIQSMGPLPSTEDGRLLLGRLLEWDRECGVDSVGCAAYVPIELALQRAIFDDELGPLAREYIGSTFSWEALIEVLQDPGSEWWRTAAVSGDGPLDPAGVVGGAIDTTAAALRAAYGDPASWTWGRLHTVTFRESTLGSSGILPLELYFDPPARPVAGADGTVNNNYYRISRAYPDPEDPDYVPRGVDRLFEVTNGPSLRVVVDMDDLDGARIMITTGQSGNPFDVHYGDLIPLWATGATVPLPFSAGNVAGSAVETLTLTP